MVCHMKSQQGRFQKKSFSRILCAFSRVFFSRFAGENAFSDGFLVVTTVVRPLVRLLDPPFFYRLFRALIMYIFFYFTLSNEVNLVSMHHLSSMRPSLSDSISTFSAHVSSPLDHHVANKSCSTLS